MPSPPFRRLHTAAAAGAALLAAALLLAAGSGPAGGGGGESFELSVAPLLAAARQALRAGEWPLWHPRAGAGYPLLASADGQLLDPFTLPLYPLPADAWLPLLVLLRVACGVVLAWLLLRRHGARAGPAAMAVAVYAAGLAALAGGPSGTFAAIAPGLLLAVSALVREPRGRTATWAVPAALAALLLTAEPRPTLVALVVAAAFFVAACRPLAPRRRRTRLLRGAGLASIAGLACAPPMILALATVSHRAASLAEQRREHLLSDSLGLERAAGGPSGVVLAALLLASATLAVLALRRRGRLPHAGFFAALAAVALVDLARPPLAGPLLEFLALPPPGTLAASSLLPWLALALAWLTAAAAGSRTDVGWTGAATSGLGGTTAGPRRRAERPLATVAVLATAIVAATITAVAIAPPAPAADRDLVARLQRLQAERGYARIAATGGLLPPEQATRHGLSDVRGNGDRLPRTYVDAVHPFLGEPPAEAGAAAAFGATQQPVYDLLAVRWLITPPDPPGPPPGRLEARLPGAAIWERGSALPLLFLPDEVQTEPPAEGWIAWVRYNPDFRRRTLAQPPDRSAPRRSTATTGGVPATGVARLSVERIRATRVDALAELPAERLVASSLYQDEGWRALVDGRASPTVHANGPFVAAWLPAGRYPLTLLYRPPGWLPSCLASGLGLALAGALLPAPPRRLVRHGAAAGRRR